MSISRDSNGIFLLKDDQLVTLRNLGHICGTRIKKVARLCGEDHILLALMILRRFCDRFSRLEYGKGKLQETLNKKWQQKNQHSLFAPQSVIDEATEVYIQKYVHHTLKFLGSFLGGRVEASSANNKFGDDEILVQLVLYASNTERCSFADDHVSGSAAWRRLCKILREEKKRAVREGDLTASRDKAMSFLASIFLAQLLSTYRAEPSTAFLDFAVALYDTVISAS